MKLLSNDKLSFGSFKPIVLRGSPKENASSVFTSEVILSLSKPEKIASIVIHFKSTSITFWPEGRYIHILKRKKERICFIFNQLFYYYFYLLSYKVLELEQQQQVMRNN